MRDVSGKNDFQTAEAKEVTVSADTSFALFFNS